MNYDRLHLGLSNPSTNRCLHCGGPKYAHFPDVCMCGAPEGPCGCPGFSGDGGSDFQISNPNRWEEEHVQLQEETRRHGEHMRRICGTPEEVMELARRAAAVLEAASKVLAEVAENPGNLHSDEAAVCFAASYARESTDLVIRALRASIRADR